MTSAARASGYHDAIKALPESLRRCFAARAFEVCAAIPWMALDKQQKDGKPTDPVMLEQFRVTKDHAHALAQKDCPGSGWTKAHEHVFNAVQKAWGEDLLTNPIWRKH